MTRREKHIRRLKKARKIILIAWGIIALAVAIILKSIIAGIVTAVYFAIPVLMLIVVIHICMLE